MQRKCAGCGELKDRKNMIRITRTADGKVFVNGNSKIYGRSAYICYNKDCVDSALKKNRIHKILKAQVSEDLKGKILDELRYTCKD